MSVTRWTVDEVMAYGPCDRYPRERVKELWAGRKSLSLAEIMELLIPDQDKGWFVSEVCPDIWALFDEAHPQDQYVGWCRRLIALALEHYE